MGKDYIPVKQNNYSLLKAYGKLKGFRIDSASNIADFYHIPAFKLISEIEIGVDGTEECILRLIDGGFCVVRGTFDIEKLED